MNFTAVDDFGNIINPMIVEGQVHGGIVQGVGQALIEGAVYDKGTGQLVSGSYMDYTMPRADNFPSFKLGYKVTPCPHNPLGVKGCGEAGAIAVAGRRHECRAQRAGAARRQARGDARHARSTCGNRSKAPSTRRAE